MRNIAKTAYGKQIQTARVLLGWSVDHLAHRASVHRTTLRRIERNLTSIGGNARSIAKIEEILRQHGIEFVDKGNKFGVLINTNNSLVDNYLIKLFQ